MNTRYRMVQLLLSDNYCVRALAVELNVSESAVSQHLKILREAGIVESPKKKATTSTIALIGMF